MHKQQNEKYNLRLSTIGETSIYELARKAGSECKVWEALNQVGTKKKATKNKINLDLDCEGAKLK